MKVIKWGKTTGIAIVLSTLFVTTACNKTEEVVQEVIETPVAVAETYAGSLSGE
ncbi:hypothetical protein KHA80_11880 [Anaerobacillus sp. HL2]|nr:hypothetical protein KHA80_11880 [Anaerobacillus sp. HL2]